MTKSRSETTTPLIGTLPPHSLTHSRATLARSSPCSRQPTNLRLTDSLLNPRWMSFSAAAGDHADDDVCCLRKDGRPDVVLSRSESSQSQTTHSLELPISLPASASSSGGADEAERTYSYSLSSLPALSCVIIRTRPARRHLPRDRSEGREALKAIFLVS